MPRLNAAIARFDTAHPSASEVFSGIADTRLYGAAVHSRVAICSWEVRTGLNAFGCGSANA